MIFPIMMYFLNSVNALLTHLLWYKKSALWVARRAKKGAGDKLEKYGYWGLALFVMVPLPGTGVYVGSIVTYLFKMNTKKAFIANTAGITISSLIVWSVTYFGKGMV